MTSGLPGLPPVTREPRPVTAAVDVHFRVEGDLTSGAPLVFVHAVGSGLESWDDVVAELPKGRALVRYDLRGHSWWPTPPGGPWNVDDFVLDHLQFLAHLGIEAADTVGFSLGGLIVQRIAATHPEVVRNLVVIGAVASRTEQEKAAVLAHLAMVETGGPGGAARKSVERWYSKEYLAEHPDAGTQIIARMERLDREAYTNAYRVLATTDLADDLGCIRAPLLAMTGEFDAGSPPRMSQLMADRTGGRRVVLPGARHTVLQECPELIAKEIATHVC
jgi:pimeloyl-ACP methyl ester carboxylesterase